MRLCYAAGNKVVAIFDNETDRDYVICTVGIRDVGTCELKIPRDRFDPWLVSDALSRAETN